MHEKSVFTSATTQHFPFFLLQTHAIDTCLGETKCKTYISYIIDLGSRVIARARNFEILCQFYGKIMHYNLGKGLRKHWKYISKQQQQRRGVCLALIISAFLVFIILVVCLWLIKWGLYFNNFDLIVNTTHNLFRRHCLWCCFFVFKVIISE